MTTNKLGIDHTGTWTPKQYAIDVGWSRECVSATAEKGVSEEDADGLSAEQQSALLDWCKSRVADEPGKMTESEAIEWLAAWQAGVGR